MSKASTAQQNVMNWIAAGYKIICDDERCVAVRDGGFRRVSRATVRAMVKSGMIAEFKINAVRSEYRSND